MTAHDGAQVSFIESYAQPRAVANDDDDASPARKLAQLRPSLVIAGDVKALEVVRTVHSPKAAAHSPRAASAGPPRRRKSISETLDGAVQHVVATSHASSSERRRVWRDKLLARSSGSLDFALSVLVLLYVCLCV